MTEKDVLDIFRKKNALLNGHFKLSSGLHSGKYLQCAIVLQYPDVAEKLAKDIAKRFMGENIDFVVGPAFGGVTLAYEVARALGVRGIFTERQDGKMTRRRGFSVASGEKALVVEDVVTTGGSTKEVIDVLESLGAKTTGVACVIDRSGGKAEFHVKFEALAKIVVETFQEGDCPLCKSGISITKPGSRGK
ncbi:MAG: orotate phosphoribosyltransferase [Candidatus Omnitrophica bacterium]|nr:orotate phosphoribosyltransferase [Candidatus Omnitrophota bacterium]